MKTGKEMHEVEDVKEVAVCIAEPEQKATEEESPAAKFTELFAYADCQDKLYISLGICAAIISGLSQPGQLILFGSIMNAFNDSTTEESVKLVSFLSIMYFVIGCQTFLTNFAQTALMSAAAGRQTKRIREFYFGALLRKDIQYFDKHDQGSLATSVMERTLVIQDGMGEKFALGIQFTTAFFAGLAVALYYVWQLALLICGVIPIIIILIGLIVVEFTKASTRSTNAYSSAGNSALQALGAIRTVFALGVEKKEVHMEEFSTYYYHILYICLGT